MDAQTLAQRTKEHLAKGTLKGEAGKRSERYRSRARQMIKAMRDGDDEELAKLLEANEAHLRDS